MRKLFITTLMLWPGLAWSFQNEFLKFDLPRSWMCQDKAPNWVCTPQSSEDKTEALVVISAKKIGPGDSLPNYLKHLSEPKMLKSSKYTSPVPSKVQRASARVIDGQHWVEALHLGSEVEGFYTLYLATRYKGLAILVTLSADQKKAGKYNRTFTKAMKSLEFRPEAFRDGYQLPQASQKKNGGLASGVADNNLSPEIESDSGSFLEFFLKSKLLLASSFAVVTILLAGLVYAIRLD